MRKSVGEKAGKKGEPGLRAEETLAVKNMSTVK